LHAKKTAFVVEHDFIMATYLADRVIVFDGEPAKAAQAKSLVGHTLSVCHLIDYLQTSIATRRHESIFGTA
jgi:translation initiation factor RLI1